MSNLVGTSLVQIKLSNKTNYKGEIYVFVQSQTQIYQIDPSSYLASPVTSPANGNAPSITISSLPNQSFFLDASKKLKSGRIYFSTSEKAVKMNAGSISGPPPNADFMFDFVELTIYTNKNGDQCVNIDTTQIDQFGMPINVQVYPNDPNYLDGTGILKQFLSGAVVDRTKVISNFKNLTQKKAFSSYADCIKTSPIQRLIGPQHAINEKLPQSQYWVESLTPQTTKNSIYTAKANIIGTWDDKSPSTYPSGEGLDVGMRVSGQGIPAGTTISKITSPTKDNPAYQITMESSVRDFDNKSGAYISVFPDVNNDLSTAFDQAIYNLFKNYTEGKELYICANGTDSGIEIYKGTVLTDYELPAGITDMNGNAKTKYTVFKFTGTGKKYVNPNNTLSDSTSQGDYVVFYPFFNTNCTESPNKGDLDPEGGLPSPPQWFTPNFYPKKGNMNFIAPPSFMVFACGGTFADSVYQNKAFQATTSPLIDDTALGNIENQLVTMLNRGLSEPDNFILRTGFIKSSDLAPIDFTNPTQTSKTYSGATGASGATTNYKLPGASASEPSVIMNSISGTVTLSDGKTQQTFSVSNGSFTVTALSSTEKTEVHSYINNIIFNPPTQADNIQIQWSIPPGPKVKVEFKYEYGKKLSNKYATINLISPYVDEGGAPFYKAGEFGPKTNLVDGVKKGMQMTTMAQFSTPMTVYAVPSSGDQLIIESSVDLQPFNTGILLFADFYPLKSINEPDGVWNAYSYYFHQGDLGEDIPTVDGRGYAFPFDDNGGYSSDLSVVLDLSKSISAGIDIELLPW